MEIYTALFQQCLWLSLKVLTPLLLGLFLTGLILSFLGNFFQIQEGSFVQIPKMFVAAFILLIFLPWQIALLSEYFHFILTTFYR